MVELMAALRAGEFAGECDARGQIRTVLVRMLLVALVVIGLLTAGVAVAAPGVNADVTVRAEGTYSGAATSAGTPSFRFNLGDLTQLSPGTGVGFADKLYYAQRTIAASSTENLDLAGALTDPLGATITCAKVKSLTFVAAAGNTNSVVVGGAGSNTFVGPFADATDKISIPPGGAITLTHPGAGWTVTASTGDILLVANSSSGSGVTYDVLITCATA